MLLWSAHVRSPPPPTSLCPDCISDFQLSDGRRRIVCTKIAWLMNKAHIITCSVSQCNRLFEAAASFCQKSWSPPDGSLCCIPQRLRVCGCVCRTHCVSTAELVVHCGLCKYYLQHKCSATWAHKGMETFKAFKVKGQSQRMVNSIFQTDSQK